MTPLLVSHRWCLHYSHYRGDKCGIVESYTAIPTGVCVPAPDDDDYYADDDDGEHMDLFNKDSIIKCTGKLGELFPRLLPAATAVP